MSMLSLCFAAFLIFQSASGLSAQQTHSDSTDAAVYAAVLDSVAPAGKPIVLLDSTRVITSHSLELEHWIREEKIDSAMVADLLGRGASPQELPREIPVEIKIHRAREQDRPFGEAKDPNAAWAAFYARFPGSGGLFRLSSIGYNPDRSRAMLYVSRGCGSRCGWGRVLVLSRTDETWRIERDILLWIS